jgi:hypothetical protein
MKRLLSTLAAVGLLVAIAVGPASAGVGPPHAGFYIDGTVYRTIGTPTDFSKTDAQASSFDTLYQLDEPGTGLLDVATAAPGDPGYNGGRWMVFAITWNVPPVQLTSDEQVLQYAVNGWITISSDPVKLFECPVIKA